MHSVQQLARLPPDKIDRIQRLLQQWSRKKTCTRRDLESLIGSLHHACRVVVPGRTFLRRMIDLLCCFRHRNHPIRLNVDFHRDLQWWLSFFKEWNGVSFFLSPAVSPLPDLVVSSDAFGSYGFGALWRTEWFCSSWFFLPSRLSIAFLKLVPIVGAEIIPLLTLCMVCAYRSSAAWFLTPIRSPVKSRHHCSRSWYLLLDPPVFWSLGSGLGSMHSSCLRCWAAGLLPILLQFFPAIYFPSAEWLLMLFATWLDHTRKLAPSSVSSYIAAVRSWHIDLGAPDPTSGATRLARFLRGIRRSRTSPAVVRLPITNRLMLVRQSALAVPLFDYIMFWAACCTAFFGFLRVSEFTCSSVFVPGRHLGFDDIEWDAAGHYRLFLHTSKTDPFHHGCTILLGPSGHQVCPVAAMSRYLAIRGFTSGPLFICANGTPLSPSMVNAWLRSIFKGAGVPGNYSSHSFRIGAATFTALAGVPDRVI